MPVQNDKTGDRSLLQCLRAYCKSELHMINRIDRPVSGLVIFTKNKKSHVEMQKQFSGNDLIKEYLAIVEKADIPREGKIHDFIRKSRQQHKSHITQDPADQACILEYQVICELDRYLVLHIYIKTGRFHQIRAQLAHLGVPVKSDVKYGARRGSADRSICLHAWKYSFLHPSTHQIMRFEAPIPDNQIWPVIKTKLHQHE